MTNEYIAHQETLGEFTLKIVANDDPLDPREEYNGHLGKMVCWHRRYNLGDEQPKESPNVYLGHLAGELVKAYDWELIPEEHIQRILDKHLIRLPLYLYDHSGITMSTSKFSCPWDSGQVGFIYCTVVKAKEEFDGDDWRERAIKCLQQEVEVYDDYLTNNCYGYEITNGDGDIVDSRWGYLGDWNSYVLEEGRSQLKWWYERTPEQKMLPFEETNLCYT